MIKMNIKNTETEKNLIKSLKGEALAHMKYTIYAKLLGKSSKSIEKQIEEIAHNEKEHWKVYAKLLLEEDYYDDDRNLVDAIMGEHLECLSLYPEYARIAREEGFDAVPDARGFAFDAIPHCSHFGFDTIKDCTDLRL